MDTCISCEEANTSVHRGDAKGNVTLDATEENNLAHNKDFANKISSSIGDYSAPVELLLQAFIGIVDAELLKAVLHEALEAVDVQN